MRYALGNSSRSKLAGVDPDMVKVVILAIQKTKQDFMVLEGVRTHATQRVYYGKGRTPEELVAVGLDPKLAQPTAKKVTWTLNSNHFQQADGFGRAVDLCPYPVDWDTPGKFDEIARAMFSAASQLGIPIRWGADWDMDGNPRERGESDSPHFEIVT